MGIDLLAFGNHKIEFNDPNKIVQIFSGWIRLTFAENTQK